MEFLITPRWVWVFLFISISPNIKGKQPAKWRCEEGAHLICSLLQLCLVQVLPTLEHQAFFRIFSAGCHRLHVLDPACDKVTSYANTLSAWCFNNLQKERINTKPPDLTHRNTFTTGKKMGVSPQKSVKATVLSSPSCDYKHSAKSYLWLFSLCSRKIKPVEFSQLFLCSVRL